MGVGGWQKLVQTGEWYWTVRGDWLPSEKLSKTTSYALYWRYGSLDEGATEENQEWRPQKWGEWQIIDNIQPTLEMYNNTPSFLYDILARWEDAMGA